MKSNGCDVRKLSDRKEFFNACILMKESTQKQLVQEPKTFVSSVSSADVSFKFFFLTSSVFRKCSYFEAWSSVIILF